VSIMRTVLRKALSQAEGKGPLVEGDKRRAAASMVGVLGEALAPRMAPESNRGAWRERRCRQRKRP
jgi:hypothetical protein